MSPDDQYARIEKWCDDNGHTILQRHDEIDVSGSKMSRPKLDLVLTRIKEGISEGIVVADRSRFSRTLLGAMQALEAINGSGGAFLAADGFDSTSPEGRLGVNLMLSFAQFELERIRGAWERATKRAVEDGVHVGPTPYGYLRELNPNPKPGQSKWLRQALKVDPVTGPLVTEAFSLRASGVSWTEVAERLGVGRSSAMNIIRNDTYLGTAKGPHGQRLEHAHPALTDEETFHRAQPGTRAIAGASRPVGVLRGLVRCATCGHAMSIQGQKHAWAQYMCSGRSKDGKCPAPAGIKVATLDKYVNDLLWDLLWKGDPGAWAIINDDHAYEDAKRELARAQDQRQAFINVADAIDADAFRQGLAVRDSAVEAARKNLGALPGPNTSVIGKTESQLTIEDLRAEMRRFLESATVSKAGRGRQVPVADRVSVIWR